MLKHTTKADSLACAPDKVGGLVKINQNQLEGFYLATENIIRKPPRSSTDPIQSKQIFWVHFWNTQNINNITRVFVQWSEISSKDSTAHGPGSFIKDSHIQTDRVPESRLSEVKYDRSGQTHLLGLHITDECIVPFDSFS